MKTSLPANGDRKLWFPLRNLKGSAIKSQGLYRAVERLNIMVDADLERKAHGAVIAFPLEGLAYFIEDVQQLREIIEKLRNIETQITGRGQTKIVAFDNRPDWSE